MAPTLDGWCGRPSTHVVKRDGRWWFFCHEHASIPGAGEVLTVDEWFSRTPEQAALTGWAIVRGMLCCAGSASVDARIDHRPSS